MKITKKRVSVVLAIFIITGLIKLIFFKVIKEDENGNFVFSIIRDGYMRSMDLKVYIDDNLLINKELPGDLSTHNDGFNYEPVTPAILSRLPKRSPGYSFSMSPGIYKIKIISEKGNAFLEDTFLFLGQCRWGYIEYVGVKEENRRKYYNYDYFNFHISDRRLIPYIVTCGNN